MIGIQTTAEVALLGDRAGKSIVKKKKILQGKDVMCVGFGMKLDF